MSIQLTSGAVRKLEEHPEKQLYYEAPILQVIEIKEVKGTGANGSYAISLSDGVHYLRAMLIIPPEAKDRELCHRLRENSIIRATHCFRSNSTVPLEHSIGLLPPFDLLVVEHPEKIGNPTYIRDFLQRLRAAQAFEEESTSCARPHNDVNQYAFFHRFRQEGKSRAMWNRIVASFVDVSGNVDLASFRQYWHSDEARAERGALHQKNSAQRNSLNELNSAKERYNRCLQNSKYLHKELKVVQRKIKVALAEIRTHRKFTQLENDLTTRISQVEAEITTLRAREEQLAAELKTAECDRTSAWKILKSKKGAHGMTGIEEAEDFEMAEQKLQNIGRRRKKLHMFKSSASKSIIHVVPSDFDRRRTGDCPICLDKLPSFNKKKHDSIAFMPCCGSWACISCVHELIGTATQETLHGPLLSALEYNPTDKYHCPLCRDPLPFTPQSAGIALVSQSAKGDPLCQYLLAHFHLGLYRKGHPILPRPTRALGVKLLKDAADRRYPPACILLGNFYLEGLEDEGKILFKRCVPKALQMLHSVEDTSDPQILSMLADVYHREGNKYKNLVYLKSAAEAGHAGSAGKIGSMYLSCKDKGQRGNAKKYLRLAAEEGGESSRGKYGFYLANLYRDEGDIENYISALDTAAKCHAEASYVLGGYYLTGKHVELDREKARFYLNQAANMGHAAAKEVMELRGLSVTEFEDDAPSTASM